MEVEDSKEAQIARQNTTEVFTKKKSRTGQQQTEHYRNKRDSSFKVRMSDLNRSYQKKEDELDKEGGEESIGGQYPNVYEQHALQR